MGEGVVLVPISLVRGLGDLENLVSKAGKQPGLGRKGGLLLAYRAASYQGACPLQAGQMGAHLGGSLD